MMKLARPFPPPSGLPPVPGRPATSQEQMDRELEGSARGYPGSSKARYRAGAKRLEVRNRKNDFSSHFKPGKHVIV